MEILTNSRKIAETYKKRHANVTDVIRKFIKRNPELSKHFIESSYITDWGKCHPIFHIDDVGTDILTNKFKYNVRAPLYNFYKWIPCRPTNCFKAFITIFDFILFSMFFTKVA